MPISAETTANAESASWSTCPAWCEVRPSARAMVDVVKDMPSACM